MAHAEATPRFGWPLAALYCRIMSCLLVLLPLAIPAAAGDLSGAQLLSIRMGLMKDLSAHGVRIPKLRSGPPNQHGVITVCGYVRTRTIDGDYGAEQVFVGYWADPVFAVHRIQRSWWSWSVKRDIADLCRPRRR